MAIRRGCDGWRVLGALVSVVALLVTAGVVAERGAGAEPPPPATGCGPVVKAGRVPLDTPKAIPDQGTATSSMTWPAGTGYVHDVDVELRTTHPFPADLDVTLTSPSGTVVVLTTDNGGSNDNVFSQTWFDDEAEPAADFPIAGPSKLVTDATYANGVNQPLLVPEGALASFDGEPGAGTWTLTVVDDAGGDAGTLDTWSMALATTPSPPQWLERRSLPTGSVPLPDGEATSFNLSLSGIVGPIEDVQLSLSIDHPDDDQLDVALRSPAGTWAVITTDNGNGANRFSSTQVTDDAATPVSDANFGAALSAVAPEEAMSVFDGEDPNGNWVLRVVDDTADGVGGTMGSQRLFVRTGSCPPAPTAAPIDAACGTPSTTTVQAGGLPKPVVDEATANATIAVAGTSGIIRDVDVLVGVDHQRPSDLNIRLVSPLGTTVQLADGIGGLNDDVLRTVRFDDDADPDGAVPYDLNDGVGSDGAYRNSVPAFRLTPQQALAVLEGQTANGTWTLVVQDELSPIAGTLTSFSLVITTATRIPASVQTPWAGSGGAVPSTGLSTSTLTKTVTVTGQTLPVTSAMVALALPHPRPSDLDIVLRSPEGTSVTLTTDNGGTNVDRFSNVVFFDDAEVSVLVDGAGPAGNVRPEEPLAAFAGESANGTWTLQVHDDQFSEAGSLTGWSLELFTGRCNRAPVAANQTYSVAETVPNDIPVAEGLAQGATDPDGDAITSVVVVSLPSHGDLDWEPDGSFRYTPDRRYLGFDSFAYRVVDALGAQSPPKTAALTIEPPTCAPPGPFTDVPDAHPFCDEILWMVNDGVTTGYVDGTFKPGAGITRQAMAAFLYRYHNPGALKPTCPQGPFPDVSEEHPFCGEIAWLVGEGITEGYQDGTFRPSAGITRQAMAAFLYRYDHPGAPKPACVADAFPDVPTSHPFCGEVAWLVGKGITEGYQDGTFRPSAGITRQAMAAFLFRYAHPPSV